MTFSEFRAHSEPLFRQLNILKFTDNICIINCIFVHDFLRGNLPRAFESIFIRADEIYSTETRQVKSGMLFTPRYKSTEYGLKSIYKSCINSWNSITLQINKFRQSEYRNKLVSPDIDLKSFSRGNLNKIISEYIISTYTT